VQAVGHFLPLDLPQVLELVLQLLATLSCEVNRLIRHRLYRSVLAGDPVTRAPAIMTK
jgi:hypothetical protein